MMFLRDLKRKVATPSGYKGAYSKPKVMALVLGEDCTGVCSCKTGIHAIHGNKRSKCALQDQPLCPVGASGLSGLSVLGVMVFRQAHACLQSLPHPRQLLLRCSTSCIHTVVLAPLAYLRVGKTMP